MSYDFLDRWLDPPDPPQTRDYDEEDLEEDEDKEPEKKHSIF